MAWYVAAVDQGTTSTRVIAYDAGLTAVATHQMTHKQVTPQPGWLQHDPMEIWGNTEKCINECFNKVQEKTGSKPLFKGVGITNQRETVVVWDKATGKPLHDAVVWCDLRSQEIVDRIERKTGGKDNMRPKTGLPCSPYFSAFKIMWLMENVPAVQEGLTNGTALLGTIDSWLLWNLTKKHCISVCNASRTFLMDINTLKWDEELLELFGVPASCLPEIVTNTCELGTADTTALAGTPVTSMIGDQHAATVGQLCFEVGDTKNTYGTGCFLLMNIGKTPKPSTHGLLTTLCYQLKGEEPMYAFEGSVVQAGMLVTWLKENMEILSNVAEVESLAAQVEDTGGVVIVPAFSGLFAPHWKEEARGIICGLTMYTRKPHLCRAALTSIAMQTVDVVKAMELDSGIKTGTLKVDGGMTVNKVLMQLQADLAEVDVSVPDDKETTARGAAICAAIGAGCYSSLQEAKDTITKNDAKPTTFTPSMPAKVIQENRRKWDKAIERSCNWVELDEQEG